MERLDQGHLHPKLEVPGLIGPGRESNAGPRGEHSRTEPFENTLLTAIRNIYIWARDNIINY